MQRRSTLASPIRRSHASKSVAGYSLLEMMIAMSVLVFIGGGLAALLSRALDLWRDAERTAKVYDLARAVLELISRDLRGAIPQADIASGADVRFLCDLDERGRQRLRFVRAIAAETADPLLREGGRFLTTIASASVDGSDDAREAREGRLAPPAGREEVLWALDPRPGETGLWRGTRSPIGGVHSLFRDRNLEELPESGHRLIPGSTSASSKTESAAANARETGSAPLDPLAGIPLARVAKPITDHVLYLGFAFWGPTTNTWDPLSRPLRRPEPGATSGPLLLWDSTRAVLDERGATDELVFGRIPESLGNPMDDMFPELVEVTLVVREEDEELGARLLAPLSESGTEIQVSKRISLSDDPRARFVLVDDEWIAIDDVDDRRCVVARDGRGARGTRATPHAVGTRVERGSTFRRVIELPGSRVPYEARASRIDLEVTGSSR
jgi:type II secretory pathway pseudopilin PulG